MVFLPRVWNPFSIIVGFFQVCLSARRRMLDRLQNLAFASAIRPFSARRSTMRFGTSSPRRRTSLMPLKSYASTMSSKARSNPTKARAHAMSPSSNRNVGVRLGSLSESGSPCSSTSICSNRSSLRSTRPSPFQSTPFQHAKQSSSETSLLFCASAKSRSTAARSASACAAVVCTYR